MRQPMSRADRARQFAPFSALRELEGALRAREHTPLPRAELAPEAQEALDRRLHTLTCGEPLTAVYYTAAGTVTVSGVLTALDLPHTLTVDSTAIRLADLYELR